MADFILCGYEAADDAKDNPETRRSKRLEAIWTKINFGRWIRNAYGLWDRKNPYVKLAAEGDDPMHPDNVSGRIMDKLVERTRAAA